MISLEIVTRYKGSGLMITLSATMGPLVALVSAAI